VRTARRLTVKLPATYAHLDGFLRALGRLRALPAPAG
jgi:hypothetical protein